MCLINVEVELEVGSFGGKAVGIKKAVEKQPVIDHVAGGIKAAKEVTLSPILLCCPLCLFIIYKLDPYVPSNFL